MSRMWRPPPEPHAPSPLPSQQCDWIVCADATFWAYRIVMARSKLDAVESCRYNGGPLVDDPHQGWVLEQPVQPPWFVAREAFKLDRVKGRMPWE